MLGSELSSLQSLHRDKHSTSPADYSVDVISLKRYPQDSSVSPFKGQDFKHDKRTDNIYIDSDTEIDESSFAASLDNMKNCALVVSGSCGSGKAMLIRELTHCFQSTKSLNSFEKMLLINTCVHKKIFVAETAQELARIQKFQEPISEQTMVNSSGFRCLVAIVCGEDFIDKVESSLTLKRILKREYLPECTILLVCPTSQVEDVGSMLKVDHHYTLQGFTDPGRDHFLELHCCSEILVFLQQNQLLDLCNKPQVCVTIASMFSKAERSKQPKNLTVFLYTLISAQLFRSFDSEEKSVIGSVDQVRLEKLPESVDATFEATCLLAKEHVLRGHKCIDREESQQFLSSFSLELSAVSLKDVFRLGLVDVAIHPKSKCVYRFIDQTVVQFLTAFYLYKQPPLNQVMFLYKYSPTLLKNDFVLWLQIFFRLVGEDYTAHLTPYNPTKFMINTLVDVLVNSLELNDDHKNRYILIKCVHELQEKSQFRKLASKHPAILNFSVSAQELNNDIQPVLSLFTNLKSSSTEWIVNTSSKNMDLVMRLKHQVRGVPIIINTDEADDTYVYLSPRRTSAEVTRMYRDVDSSKQLMSCEEKTEKFNQFCCRAVREILQRVFPLYSEVKIKGDASNLSYVSFLTCKCFEEAFLKYIKLSPLQPVHFLPGPKKDLSKVPPESLNSTDRHNLLKHNGESLEVVIMLRPVVQKVEGAVPMTSEEFTLILSHDLVLEFSDHIVSDLVASEQCVEDYMIDGSHTERILPVLPIVQKTIYGRSQTAYPKSSLPPAQTPGVEPILQPTIVQEMPDQPPLHADLHGNPNTNGITHALAAPQAPTDEYPLSDHYRINGLSHAQAVGGTSVQPSQGVFVQNFAEQAGAEARVHQAVTSRKQTALRPGTVLFTSMPEKIPSDRIQPLPLQHSLIRKGGNGSIFSENLAGTALAVKKTSYRSKEYAILTKIHHKNIIPLLAYVWGEEHAESRRRYYVYHYLPKLSGDLARLVTDKEELSLYEFHKEHQYTDLKAMGAALGNIKYILSQVLQKVTIFLK